MKIKCLIVDDELPARNVIKRYLKDIDFLHLVGECQNALEALSFIKMEDVDLMFLDIEMPKLSGLDFLRTLNRPPKVIITTAYREFAVDGFDLNATDYLLKPISFERFVAAINKVKDGLNTYDNNKQEYTYFKSGKKNIQIFFNDILFIEGLGNYVKIHTPKQVVTTYDQLTDFITKLPKHRFIRIHRSYIVAIDKIKIFGNDYLEIGTHQLSIGNTYRDFFMQTMNAKKR